MSRKNNSMKRNFVMRPMFWLALLLAGLSGFNHFNKNSQAAALSNQIYTVTNNLDSGPGSLRQAMTNPGPSTIVFNIPGAFVHTINVLTPLPTIYSTTTIDGYTQPGSSVNMQQTGSNAVPLIELNGANIVSGNSNGLNINAPDCVIRGLIINRFAGAGIFVAGPVNASQGKTATIAGCFIGTNATGSTALSNASGVVIAGSPGNIIGGTAPADRNLISGNTLYGIEMHSSQSTLNVISGNLIGTDITGFGAIANREGIFLTQGVYGNTLGGIVSGARNVISGNTDMGIWINDGNQNVVAGNYIGVSVAGSSKLANGYGIFLGGSSGNNRIGDTAALGRNVISGNNQNGINIAQNVTNTKIINNLIGTKADGINAQGNSGYGVGVSGSGNLIGDTSAGTGNIVAFNGLDGIILTASNGNAVRQNSIFGNAEVGINLNTANELITPNDPGDADTGPNNLQNFPVLSLVNSNGLVSGSLDSAVANTAYPVRIEFFASTTCHYSGYGEGEKYLGFTTLNAPGNFTANLVLAAGKPFITATATDANGNTSEFSACKQVFACPVIAFHPASLSNGTLNVGYNQMVTASGGTAPYQYSILGGNLPTNLSLDQNTGLISGQPSATGVFNFMIKATDANGCFGTRAYSVTIGQGGGVGANNLQFYPLAHPVRLLDTRPGQQGCDAPGAMIAGGTSRTQTAAGRTCDGLTIPANARALTGNVTTVESGGGYLTLYPSDAAQPFVANSNFTPNQILNNVFTVGLGANDGAFKIFVVTNTNVVVDVTGYYAPPAVGGLYFHPLPKPIRLLETRVGEAGCFTPGAPLQGGVNATQLGITSCGGVTIPVGVQALVGNATTVGPQNGGYLTLYPADAAQPFAASSNFLTGNIMNAPFTVGLSPSGQFNIFTTVTTDLVIDVSGYYSTQLNDVNGQGLLFNSLAAPIRLLDTRAGETGCFTPGAPMAGGVTYTQSAVGACVNIPATAKAVVGNATTVNVVAGGFLTFWPSNAAQPLVATSNFLAGQIFNRHFIVGLGADGAFKRYSSAGTDLVIDMSGYFAP